MLQNCVVGRVPVSFQPCLSPGLYLLHRRIWSHDRIPATAAFTSSTSTHKFAQRARMSASSTTATAGKRAIRFGVMTGLMSSALALEFIFNAVPLQNALFVIATFVYLGILNRFLSTRPAISPSVIPSAPPKNIIAEAWVMPYALLMASISVLGPWALIISDASRHVAVLAPHLYMVTAQILMESISSRIRWTVPIKLMVAVIFNSYRLVLLRDWCAAVFSVENGFDLINQGLAVVNLCAWVGNLFVLLIPTLLTRVSPEITSSPYSR